MLSRFQHLCFHWCDWLCRKHHCQGLSRAISSFFPQAGTSVKRSLTLIGCRSNYQGSEVTFYKEILYNKARCSTVYTLICFDTITFPYRTYSVIQSICYCICPQVHTSSCTTQKCQPNRITISFIFIYKRKPWDLHIVFSFPFFGNTLYQKVLNLYRDIDLIFSPHVSEHEEKKWRASGS